MELQARIVGDIREDQSPGVVQFDATKRRIWYVCPCGCGTIGWVDFIRCYFVRQPTSIYNLDFLPDGKPTMGEPMPLGFVAGDQVHEAGVLTGGKWTMPKEAEGASQEG